MSIVLLLARLALAVVFVVAGIGKLADLKGSQKAMKDFGIPDSLATPLGVLLPFAELAVVVALIPPAWAWWAAIGAAGLLLLFVAGIGFNLTIGRKPDCHCFGVFYSSPISKSTLIRNLLLVAVAGIIIAFGRTDAGPGIFAWLGALTLAQDIELVFAVIVVAFLAIETRILFEAMRQVGKLMLRVEELEKGAPLGNAASQVPGLPVDAEAPMFELPDLSGQLVSLDSLSAKGKPVLLTFVSPTCGPCQAMMPDYAQWVRDHSDRLTFALITQGTAEENLPKYAEYNLNIPILLQKEAEVAQAYLVRGTPSGVIVKFDGGISSPLAEGEDEILALIKEATIVLPSRPRQLPILHAREYEMINPKPPKVGELAPDITMPDLDGHLINLGDFLGKPTLVLFWSTTCGYCQAMLRDIKGWEAKASKDAPQLLVISSGDAKVNRAQGFRAPVMLDDGNYAQRMFGASGTPIAVLLDENGYVISELAMGADEVMSLAKKPMRSKQKPKPAAV